MNVYVPIPRLPSAYQEVEYIQSSWTQYINTWFIPNNNTKVELSMWWWSNVGTYCDLFWVRYAWSETWRWFMLWKNSNDTYVYAMFWTKYSGSSWYSSFSFYNGNNHTLEMSQSWIYEDGTLRASLSSSTFTSPTNMTIFALNDNWTISEQSAYKLYYFKIWNNWTLVRNFIPCYRKQDNVIWLYDLVNSVFYTNSWSWTFSKGNDVTMTELKNAYIGEYIPVNWLLWYRPLQSDLKDASWNWHNWSWYSWTWTFSSSWWYTWARMTNSWSGNNYATTQHVETNLVYGSRPISICYWFNAFSRWDWCWVISNANASDNLTDYCMRLSWSTWQWSASDLISSLWNNNNNIITTYNTNTRYFFVITIDSSWNWKIYRNWNNVVNSWTWWLNATNNWKWRIWARNTAWTSRWIDWLMRHCAIYNKVLTVDEILQFYNNTN